HTLFLLYLLPLHHDSISLFIVPPFVPDNSRRSYTFQTPFTSISSRAKVRNIAPTKFRLLGRFPIRRWPQKPGVTTRRRTILPTHSSKNSPRPPSVSFSESRWSAAHPRVTSSNVSRQLPLGMSGLVVMSHHRHSWPLSWVDPGPSIGPFGQRTTSSISLICTRRRRKLHLAIRCGFPCLS